MNKYLVGTKEKQTDNEILHSNSAFGRKNLLRAPQIKSEHRDSLSEGKNV